MGIHPTKAWLSQLVNFKNAIWHFRRTICNKILVSRTLLSILADLNHAMSSLDSSLDFELFQSFLKTFWRPFRVQQSQLISVHWLGLSICFNFRFFLFSHHYTSSSLFFLLVITWSGLLAGIRWPVCISKFQIILCFRFSGAESDLRAYHLAVWSNFNFWHNFQWITFLTQSYLL